MLGFPNKPDLSELIKLLKIVIKLILILTNIIKLIIIFIVG